MNAYSTMIGTGLLALAIAPKTLADALAAMKAPGAAVIEGRNTLPILSCVLLEARGDLLTVHGTDLDMIVSVECPIAGEGDGTVAIEFDALQKAVKAATGETLRIIDTGDGRVTVESGNRSARVPTREAIDFPILRGPDGMTPFELDAADLKHDLDRVASAISKEEARYYLRGALFHTAPGDDGQPRLRIAATDGHRLGAIDRPAPDAMPEFPDAIVPAKAIEWLRRRGLKGGGKISAAINGAKAIFTIGRLRMITKLVDGSFPDYSRVIPRYAKKSGAAHLIAGDAETLGDAAKEASAQQTGKTRAFLLSAGDGWGTAYSYCPDNGTASALIDGTAFTAPGFDGAGNPVDAVGEFGASFNARYFSEAMATFKGQTVTLAMQDASCPALIESDAWPEYLVVLMPMRGDGAPVKTPDDLRKMNRDAIQIFAEDCPGLIETTAHVLSTLDGVDIAPSLCRTLRKEARAKLGAMITAAIDLMARRTGWARYDARCTILRDFADMNRRYEASIAPAPVESDLAPAPGDVAVEAAACLSHGALVEAAREAEALGGDEPAPVEGPAPEPAPETGEAEPETGEVETPEEASARIRASQPLFANMQEFKARAGKGSRWTIEHFNDSEGWTGLRTVTVATVRARSIGFLRGEATLDECHAADVRGFAGRTWIDFPGQNDWTSDPEGLITYYAASDQTGRASRTVPCLRIRPVLALGAATGAQEALAPAEGASELAALRDVVLALSSRVEAMASGEAPAAPVMAKRSAAHERAIRQAAHYRLRMRMLKATAQEDDKRVARLIEERDAAIEKAEHYSDRANSLVIELGCARENNLKEVSLQQNAREAAHANAARAVAAQIRMSTRVDRLKAVNAGRKRQVMALGRDLLIARMRSASALVPIAPLSIVGETAPVAGTPTRMALVG